MLDQAANYLLFEPSAAFLRSVILSILTIFLGALITARGKLRWGTSHQYTYILKPAPDAASMNIRVAQLWIYNSGRAHLDNVEVLLNFNPAHLEAWPPRQFDRQTTLDGRVNLLFNYLGAGEGFTVSMLSDHNMPEVLAVRSKNGVAKRINVAPMRVYPKWFAVSGVLLAVFGAISLVLYIVPPIVHLAQIAEQPSAPTSTPTVAAPPVNL